MPREHIQGSDDHTVIHVGWDPHGGGVQVGVGVTDGPLLRHWINSDGYATIGRFVRELSREHDTIVASCPTRGGTDGHGGGFVDPPTDEAIDYAYGQRVVEFLTQPGFLPYQDQWTHLNDRRSVQALLRLLKRARNSVWGADE